MLNPFPKMIVESAIGGRCEIDTICQDTETMQLMVAFHTIDNGVNAFYVMPYTRFTKEFKEVKGGIFG